MWKVRKDITGQVFGKVTVIKPDFESGDSRMWICKCQCGIDKSISRDALKSGATVSCGCVGRTSNLKHGMHTSRTYTSWSKMKSRCLNPNDDNYYLYGGRGIFICEKWLSFEGFLADMGERPEGMTLDRIDSDKEYSLENCRWSTPLEQTLNRGVTVKLTYKGETYLLVNWCNRLHLDRKLMYSRIIENRWSVERAFEEDKRLNQHAFGERNNGSR
jgi:hypothetical protein